MLGRSILCLGFIVSLGAKKPWMRLVQILLLAAALVSVRPLQDWAFGTPVGQMQAHLTFTQIKNVDELKQRHGRGERQTGDARSLCRLVCRLQRV